MERKQGERVGVHFVTLTDRIAVDSVATTPPPGTCGGAAFTVEKMVGMLCEGGIAVFPRRPHHFAHLPARLPVPRAHGPVRGASQQQAPVQQVWDRQIMICRTGSWVRSTIAAECFLEAADVPVVAAEAAFEAVAASVAVAPPARSIASEAASISATAVRVIRRQVSEEKALRRRHDAQATDSYPFRAGTARQRLCPCVRRGCGGPRRHAAATTPAQHGNWEDAVCFRLKDLDFPGVEEQSISRIPRL